jgi:large subunit ribosomal protein L15
MELHSLEAPIPNKKTRKRVGRGEGSGLGKQSGKGHKGQKARGTGKVARGFEGGQMPLQRRLPKFGFKNPFRTEYVALNLSVIEDAIKRGKLGAAVTLADLHAANLADRKDKVKLLGQGDITSAVSIEVHACSAAAKEKVEKAGGSVTILAAVESTKAE